MTDRAKEYFTKLQAAIDDENNEDVIDISTQILNFSPDDVETRQCRVVANLMEGNYQEAYNDLTKLKGCEFERCYCLYKLEKYHEALEIAEKHKGNEEQWIHLRGQIYFYLDRSEECVNQYSLLNKENVTEDTLVNISAAVAISGKTDMELNRIDDSSLMEQLYNTAIAYYEAGKTEEALEFIERASKMNNSETNLFSQLFNIFRALYTKHSDDFDPSKVLISIAEDQNSNKYARAVAANNYYVLNPDEKAIHKKYRNLYSQYEKSLGSRKSERLSFLITSFLLAHSFGESKKLASLIDDAKKIDFDPLIVESLVRTMDPTSAKSTEFADIFNAQSKLCAGSQEEAAKILAASKYHSEPRCVAVVADLFAAAGNNESAIEYIQNNQNDSVEFLQYAVIFALNHGDPRSAQKWADKLTKATSNSPMSVALLAYTYAENDPEMAERYVQRIKINKLSSEELDELENMTFTTKTTIHNESEMQIISEEPLVQMSKRKAKMEKMTEEKLKKYKLKCKRRRRLQLPTNYDPTRIMDPERWVKKSQRLGGKRKKAKVPIAKSAGLGGKAITAPKQQQNKGKKPKKGRKSKW